MLWTDTPSGKTRAAEHHLWGALGDRADFVADKINSDSAYLDRIARFALGGALESSTDIRIARIALGNSFIELADCVRFYSAQFDEEQLQQALQFPWHEDVLMGPCPFNKGKRICDTHTAFFGVEKIGDDPLTVAKWITLCPATGKPKKDQPTFYFSDNPWHIGQPHTDVATLLPCWHLLLTEFVPGSTGRSPGEQLQMLPPEYEPPTTNAEVTKNVLVCRKTGLRPNPSRWVRCAETTVKTETCSAGVLSVVGGFDGDGLSVSRWYGNRSDFIGCGASRKPPEL